MVEENINFYFFIKKMSTLIKRIIFIVILLSIWYCIYRLFDRQWANELKDDIINKTQETTESFIDDTQELKEQFDQNLENSVLETYSWVITEQNIIVNDPEIKEPIVQPTIIKKTSTNKPKTTSSSSNILFELFK